MRAAIRCSRRGCKRKQYRRRPRQKQEVVPVTVRAETHLLARQDMVMTLLRRDQCLEAYVLAKVMDVITCVRESISCQQAPHEIQHQSQAVF